MLGLSGEKVFRGNGSGEFEIRYFFFAPFALADFVAGFFVSFFAGFVAISVGSCQ